MIDSNEQSKILSNRDLFFDRGNHHAAVHQCHRKHLHDGASRQFTIDDLATMHRREFHLIHYNANQDQRFLNLIENLQSIYSYESKSDKWKIYLKKSKHSARKKSLEWIPAQLTKN